MAATTATTAVTTGFIDPLAAVINDWPGLLTTRSVCRAWNAGMEWKCVRLMQAVVSPDTKRFRQFLSTPEASHWLLRSTNARSAPIELRRLLLAVAASQGDTEWVRLLTDHVIPWVSYSFLWERKWVCSEWGCRCKHWTGRCMVEQGPMAQAVRSACMNGHSQTLQILLERFQLTGGLTERVDDVLRGTRDYPTLNLVVRWFALSHLDSETVFRQVMRVDSGLAKQIQESYAIPRSEVRAAFTEVCLSRNHDVRKTIADFDITRNEAMPALSNPRVKQEIRLTIENVLKIKRVKLPQDPGLATAFSTFVMVALCIFMIASVVKAAVSRRR